MEFEQLLAFVALLGMLVYLYKTVVVPFRSAGLTVSRDS